MGNMCIGEDTVHYSQAEYCYKCRDTFYYRKPRRKSCRIHDFDKNGVCKICHKDTDTRDYCYHVKKERFWGLCDC